MSSHTYQSGGKKVIIHFKGGNLPIVTNGSCKGSAEMGFMIEIAPSEQRAPQNNRAGCLKRKIGDGGKF